MVYSGSNLHLLRPSFLRQTWEARQYHPKTDSKLVKSLLTEYGLELTNPQLLSAGGRRSQSLIIETSAGKKVFKKYKPTVIEPAIVQEHSILNRLAELDFPSPRLVTTKTGGTWLSRGEDHYALCDFIAGGFQYHKYILLPGQARQFITLGGQILARLHQQLQGFEPEGYNQNGFKSPTEDRWRDLAWFLDKLAYCTAQATQPQEGGKAEAANRLEQRAKSIEASLLELEALLSAAALSRGIIHGDYGPYNLLFRKNAPVVILDFEIAHLDWRLTEVVDAMWRFAEDRWAGLQMNKMKWLLDAYQACSPLSQNELQLLPAVWIYLHTRRCIMHWHHYCTTQADFRLATAHQHLQLADWMRANQDRLMATLGLAPTRF
jgi:Ser/Thr protein kinase RdoA (MazF antagonist)